MMSFIVFNYDFFAIVLAKGICRPLFAIYRKTLRLYDFRNYIGKYSDEDVAKLERLHEKYGHDWATIGHCMGRSSASVKDRCRLLRKNKKTGGKLHLFCLCLCLFTNGLTLKSKQAKRVTRRGHIEKDNQVRTSRLVCLFITLFGLCT